MAIIRRGEAIPATTTRGMLDPFEMMRELMGWDPWRELARATPAGGATWVPAFDVKETQDSYLFKADLPGIKQEDLDISLTGDRLTVSGKREEEKRNEGERYFSYECNYGSFSRSFTLPSGVDVEHVRGDLKDGVLSIVVPKKSEVKPKKIELSGHKGGEKAKA